MIQAFRRLCLALLHVLFWLADLLTTVQTELRRLLLPAERRDQTNEHPPGNGEGPIQLPKTVALVLAQGPSEEVPHGKLAELCSWCSNLGVQNVVLHDAAGRIHNEEDKLQEAMKQLGTDIHATGKCQPRFAIETGRRRSLGEGGTKHCSMASSFHPLL